MSKPFSAACARNREPILAVLRGAFADRQRVLEIGSGTGQHAVFFAAHLPDLVWQTSDLPRNHPGILAWQQEAGLANVLPPLVLDMRDEAWSTEAERGAEAGDAFDAVFTANTCHIMAWPEVESMFAGIGRVLPAGSVLCIYGPFNYGGRYTSASNGEFDAALRREAAHMGIRDFEAMDALASRHGLALQVDHAMPANNRLLVWRMGR